MIYSNRSPKLFLPLNAQGFLLEDGAGNGAMDSGGSHWRCSELNRSVQFGSLQRTTPATCPRQRTGACQFPRLPLTFLRLGEGAGLARMLGSALGNHEEGKGGGL